MSNYIGKFEKIKAKYESGIMCSKGMIMFLIIIAAIGLIASSFASTSLTVSFFGTIGDGVVRFSNVVLSIVNDTCKWFLPICIPFAYIKKKYFLTFALIFITICAMVFSFLASQGLDLNVANGQLLKASTKNELLGIKKENEGKIKKLEKERDDVITGLQKQIDSMPSNYKTRKRQKEQEIIDTKKHYSTLIKPYNANTLQTNTKISNYSVSSELTTEGYHALAKDIGLSLGFITKAKNIFLELLPALLSTLLGFLISLYIEAKNSAGGELKFDTPKPKIRAVSNTTYIKPASLDDSKLLRYKEAMNETSKDGICIGYKKIGEKAGLTASEARNIFEHLKATKVIATTNEGTKILKGA